MSNKEEELVNIGMLIVVGAAGLSMVLWAIARIIGMGENDGRNPVVLGVLAAVVALCLLVVSERMLPLRSMDEADWVYKYRVLGRLPAAGEVALLQCAVFFILGLLLGVAAHASLPWGLACAVALAGLRWLCGFRRVRAPHDLLQSGVSITSFKVSSFALDSELASDLATLAWMRGRKQQAFSRWGAFELYLMLSRIRRRSFSLWLLAAVLAAGLLFLPYFGKWAFVVAAVGVMLTVASVIASCSFHKAPEYNLLPKVRLLRVVIGLGLSLVSITLLASAVDVHRPWWLLLAGVFVYLGAFTRARLRRFTTFTLVDMGVGIAIPQEMLRYWIAGWSGLFVATVCVMGAFGG